MKVNSYIPKQIKQPKERVEAKLTQELIARLELYCEYFESDRDYVIASALEIAFKKDKAFTRWLEERSSSSTANEPANLAVKVRRYRLRERDESKDLQPAAAELMATSTQEVK
jgi:hypothetical protein